MISEAPNQRISENWAAIIQGDTGPRPGGQLMPPSASIFGSYGGEASLCLGP